MIKYAWIAVIAIWFISVCLDFAAGYIVAFKHKMKYKALYAAGQLSFSSVVFISCAICLLTFYSFFTFYFSLR